MLIDDIKVLLKLNDTNMYDDELNIYIPAAKAKAKMEGVTPPASNEDNTYKLYSVIIAYEVAKNIDIDIDSKRLNSMYITAVNTYRNSNVQ